MSTLREDDLRRGLRALAGAVPPVDPMTGPAVALGRRYRLLRRLGQTAIAVVAAAASTAVAVTALAGGTGGTGPASPGPGARPSPSATATAFPYQLYVHCGVNYANFDGRWWHTDPEQGRPGPGADPAITGTMTLVSPTLARFHSDDPPLDVEFHPSSPPPAWCD